MSMICKTCKEIFTKYIIDEKEDKCPFCGSNYVTKCDN